MFTLTFLIPVYKRIETALEALQSISSQIQDSHQVLIHIRDDATPGLDFESFQQAIHSIYPQAIVTRNTINLGMSANILGMVRNCTSDFCTVLTDDDQLSEGALSSILKTLEHVSGTWANTTSLFVPRYSYDEAGNLISVSCFAGHKPMLIPASPKTAMEYCSHGYILTGLIFRPQAINFGEWEKHRDNAFFPIIYFGNLLLDGDTFYLDAQWFRHTVLNYCHWETWGSNEEEQQVRLCHDFLESIDVVHQQAYARSHSFPEKLVLIPAKTVALRDRLIEKKDLVLRKLWRIIPLRLWKDPGFLLAMSLYWYFMLKTCKANRLQAKLTR